MGQFHDYNQLVLNMKKFEVEDEWTSGVENEIRRTKHDKAARTDGIHNEMLKIDQAAMVRVAVETWRLIGRSKLYPENWKWGLLTLVHKKREKSVEQNYKP